MAEYQNPSFNLWEETSRPVLLHPVGAATVPDRDQRQRPRGFAVPAGIDAAADWLRQALQDHWNGDYYVSMLDADHPRDRYDPNIDIVMASVYGAVESSDPRLLATAAQLRRQWTDPASPLDYPINSADAASGRGGPLLGRYPGDVYDGDADDSGTDHPWALCTAELRGALLRPRVDHRSSRCDPPIDSLSADFFAQVGIDAADRSRRGRRRLRDAGDGMLQADRVPQRPPGAE